MERIAEAFRRLSADALADRGVAKPLALSDGQGFDLQPVQKKRVTRHSANARIRKSARTAGKSASTQVAADAEPRSMA